LLGSGEAKAERAAMATVQGGLRVAERIEGGIAAIGGGFAATGLAVRRRIRGALTWLSRPRLPRPRAAPMRAPLPRTAPVPPPPPPFPEDGFDSWFLPVDQVEAATQEPEPPPPQAAAPAPNPVPPPPLDAGFVQAPPQPGAPQVSRPPAPPDWEKQFRSYSDNLDLDWEERVLNVNRKRRELLKWDDEDESGSGQEGTG
jgi:hypothetical protein